MREQEGISQEDLALASGLARKSVIAIELCQSDPKLSSIVRLAKALKTTPQVLLTEHVPDESEKQPTRMRRRILKW